ncbi:SIMPL domain-containing protein [Altibacter sp. HG106]|uniref:SIMPL domain-containing protein n=1 Tax=Altibacter sp. HG106 TaxID=3023937 RepID=UPI0023502354|nr:SIMPL domain-containing protein [Altibacter sp. HG106]MDC7995377.1 SIMPL domain-containing protein [Altibacter sp. HG106]
MKKIFLLLFVTLTTLSMAQESTPPQVQVSGEGTVTVVPDEVTIDIRVESTGDDAQTVKRDNDAIVKSVLQAVSAMGIAEKDVRTEYIRLNKNYNHNTKNYNYAANQAIAITLRDLEKYDAVMNRLLETGINRIDGIQFASSKAEQLRTEARTKAILNAKKKATEYAAAVGQDIGKAVLITEFQPSNGPQPILRGMAMQESSAGKALAPGELEITAVVNVSFLLE